MVRAKESRIITHVPILPCTFFEAETERALAGAKGAEELIPRPRPGGVEPLEGDEDAVDAGACDPTTSGWCSSAANASARPSRERTQRTYPACTATDYEPTGRCATEYPRCTATLDLRIEAAESPIDPLLSGPATSKRTVCPPPE